MKVEKIELFEQYDVQKNETHCRLQVKVGENFYHVVPKLQSDAKSVALHLRLLADKLESLCKFGEEVSENT